MKAMRGKASDLTIISKFFNSLSNSSQPNKANGPTLPLLMRLRLFSSMDGHTGRGQFRKTDVNDFNVHNNDGYDRFSGENGGNLGGHQKLSGENGGNLGAHQNISPHHSVSGRGAGQTPQFRRQNATPDRIRRGGRNDGFSKPFGDERSRTNRKSKDDFLKFDGSDEGRVNGGFDGDDEVKKETRPSISELLSRPLKGDEGTGQEGSDFLEKFKLGGSGNKENQPGQSQPTPPSEEEKMDPPEDADVIFKKMKQSGLIPNAVAMLDGLCKDGLIQEAMKLFGLMREKGTMPEVVVYTAVVEGFCQAQKLDDAKRIFRKMQSNGIVPNAFSYTVLIKGLCKGKRLEDAVDLCVEMLEAGHSPNVTTFTGMVHEFCKEKGVEEAQMIIGTLKQKGFFLDDKAVRDYLDKTGPTSPMVWEAIVGSKKTHQRTF